MSQEAKLKQLIASLDVVAVLAVDPTIKTGIDVGSVRLMSRQAQKKLTAIQAKCESPEAEEALEEISEGESTEEGSTGSEPGAETEGGEDLAPTPDDTSESADLEPMDDTDTGVDVSGASESQSSEKAAD